MLTISLTSYIILTKGGDVLSERTFIKVTVEARKDLKKLAVDEDLTMIEMLEKIIEEYKRDNKVKHWEA